MTRSERYDYVLSYFRREKPNVTTQLNFGSAFQLLVAILLSAQCTDKRINMVTPALFSRYPDAQSMAEAEPEELLQYISSVTYPNSKARHLVEMSCMLVRDFDGIVPDTTQELTRLPGVGRKTANVLQSVWFGKAKIAVDTHVYRVSHRLGLVSKNADTPLKVECELTRNIPGEDTARAHHWLLLHGRYICKSQRALCEQCPFDAICPKLMANSKLE